MKSGAELTQTFKQTGFIGSMDPNTSFDDYQLYLKGKGYSRLQELRIIHDNNLIFGIEAVYLVDGIPITSSTHIGKQLPHDAINQAV